MYNLIDIHKKYSRSNLELTYGQFDDNIGNYSFSEDILNEVYDKIKDLNEAKEYINIKQKKYKYNLLIMTSNNENYDKDYYKIKPLYNDNNNYSSLNIYNKILIDCDDFPYISKYDYEIFEDINIIKINNIDVLFVKEYNENNNLIYSIKLLINLKNNKKLQENYELINNAIYEIIKNT